LCACQAHKKSRRSREGSDGLAYPNQQPENPDNPRTTARFPDAPCSITREQQKRDIKLFGRFSGSHPASRPLPIFTDSGTIAFRICPQQQRTTDAHSGATTTDFHRVPILLIQPEVGPNRKASFQILKERLHVFYKLGNRIASKK